MGFYVSIEGNKKIELGTNIVTSVSYETEIPNDSNARSSDLGMDMVIKGKVLAPIAGVTDDTVKLPEWALVPAEDASCYANVKVSVVSAGITVREIQFPNAYVVSYSEKFDDEAGIGFFSLKVRQKKDLNKAVSYQGGF